MPCQAVKPDCMLMHSMHRTLVSTLSTSTRMKAHVVKYMDTTRASPMPPERSLPSIVVLSRLLVSFRLFTTLLARAFALGTPACKHLNA